MIFPLSLPLLMTNSFVPSLDLVVTRQTGGSGAWPFEEYLRQACAAISQETREAK